MKKLLFTTAFFAIMYCTAIAQNDDNCKTLIKYRDEFLVDKYDKIVKSYTAKDGDLKWVIAMKKESMNDSKWAASNAVGILKVINTICNGIQNGIAIASPQGKVIKLASKFHGVDKIKRKEKYFEIFSKSVDNIEILISEDVEEELLKGALVEELGVIGSVYQFFDDARKDINDIKDWKQLQIDVKAELNLFEKSIASYQEKLNREVTKLDQINRYKDYISEYLQINCNKSNDKIIKNNEPIIPLLATYIDKDGNWVAMGPYTYTEGFPTEKEAIDDLSFADSEISFICQRGKYKIYKINIKVDHAYSDIRNVLKVAGINDIPNE